CRTRRAAAVIFSGGMKFTVPSSSLAPQRPQLRYLRARARTVSMVMASGTRCSFRRARSASGLRRSALAEPAAMWKRRDVRRGLWWTLGVAVLAFGVIAVGPALVKPTGTRLAIVERPDAYGL